MLRAALSNQWYTWIVLADSRTMIMAVIITLAIIAVGGIGAWVLGGRMRDRGLKFGPDTLVQCRDGHIFTTKWMPGVSFNAIRFGPTRYQYCPVGKHWTFIRPIRNTRMR